MGYCRYRCGTNFWKERAAILHIAGLCIYCGKVKLPTVFDLYCETCRRIRKNTRTRKVTNND